MEALMNMLMEWLKPLSGLRAGLWGAGVVAVPVMLWAWLKKPAAVGVASVAAARGAASGFCAWVWNHLKRLAHALDYLSTQREWRYEQPWMLMLGEQSAGKTSLLRSVSASIRQSPPARAKQLQATGTEWFFLRKGALIDAEGKFSAAVAGSCEERGWHKMLDELNALRPERALDGLVLCISARTLSTAGLEAREALAASLCRQLAQLQEHIEFMLPLTVVVTQCDCINGFDAFWRSQSKVRRVELFGYAAPSQAQSLTPTDWTNDAFDTLGKRLRALQVETAASSDRIDETDEFFLFPDYFQRLRQPLSLVLEGVFHASAWQAGYLFRGLFFTGSPDAEGEIREGVREDVAFAEALLSARVLAEPGLARPTRNGVFSRSKLIRGMQYCAIGIVLSLFAALYFASLRVSSQVAALTAAQTELQRTTPDAVRSGDCLEEESIYPLLTEVARINHNTVYWALPASWLDRRVNTRSDTDIGEGAISKVLMPTLACLLENRANELVTMPVTSLTASDPDAFAKSQTLLTEKLASVRALEDNIERFTQLAERGDDLSRAELLSALAGLSRYVFDAELPPEVMHERGALSDGFSGLKKHEKLKLPSHMRDDFAAQIKRITRQLRRNLDEEVMRGANLLASLNRAEAPVLDNTQRFGQWLTWTEKSWLASTPAANPCEDVRQQAMLPLQQLVSRYGYDDSLLQELARFDVDSCYQPEMSALAKMGQAPYGVLFVPRKPSGLILAAGLRDELGGMPELLQLNFMRMNNMTRRFVCLPGSEGFHQTELAEAVGYVREYEAFAAKMKLSTTRQGIQPLYDRLARLSLASALNDAMQRSQIATQQSPDQQVSLQAVTQADQQLSAMSKELAGGLDKLLIVLRSYGDYGDAATTPVLRQCARDFASTSLSSVSALADASHLYAPAATTTGERVYDLGTLPIQKEYLARQVARAQVLGNYAAPFMNLLAGSSSVADTRREVTSTADFWRNSIDELNRYTQGKEPAGQVANLDNYFIKQLGVLDYSSCNKQLAAYQSPDFGNDLFSERRRALELIVQQRCSNRRVAQAMEAYGALAQRFNRELAGRYPFGELTAHDASLATIKAFFADYDAQRAALHEAMSGSSIKGWAEQRQFIAQLDAVAAFFRSNLLAGDAGNGAPIRLRLVFNAPDRSSAGSEQIVAWLLSSGGRAAGIPNHASTLDWQIGESLALDLTWASRSMWAPLADPQQGDLLVEGNTASFVASNPWALLRMIDQHLVADSTGAARKRLWLGFAVPQQREVSPGKSERGRVRLFLAMTLLGIDPKTQAEVTLSMPAKFPRSAPTD
jgi:type VI secretion system protein ImpL